MAVPVLLRELVKRSKVLASSEMPSLLPLLAGGVVRQTPQSRQMAAMQVYIIVCRCQIDER
jgi:hypothetical protein